MRIIVCILSRDTIRGWVHLKISLHCGDLEQVWCLVILVQAQDGGGVVVPGADPGGGRPGTGDSAFAKDLGLYLLGMY